MSDLREYTITVNGYESTVQLTAADAERLGAVPVETEKPTEAPTDVKASTVTTKARGVQNKAVR